MTKYFSLNRKVLAMNNHLSVQVFLQNLKLKRFMERKPFSMYNYMDIPQMGMLLI